MQFTQRQRPSWGRWRPVLAAIPVGLLLGFLGPFGSYPAYTTATRYAFWLGLTAAGVMSAIAAEVVLPRTRLRAGLIRIGAVALVSALPMTFVVAWTMVERDVCPAKQIGDADFGCRSRRHAGNRPVSANFVNFRAVRRTARNGRFCQLRPGKGAVTGVNPVTSDASHGAASAAR